MNKFFSLSAFVCSFFSYCCTRLSALLSLIASTLVSCISFVKLDFNYLAKVGNNNYKLNENGYETSIKNSKDYIMQGAVEKSNVNTIYAMVNLIESQRAFERSQKAISGIDKINETVINSIGNNKWRVKNGCK